MLPVEEKQAPHAREESHAPETNFIASGFSAIVGVSLSTKLVEEKAKLRQHFPSLVVDIALNHDRHYPLNPHVIVMTLEPMHSQYHQVFSSHPVSCIPMREV